MDETFKRWAGEGLVWLPERGMGYYPVRDVDEPYTAANLEQAKAYFEKYQAYAATDMGKAITQARADLVKRWWDGPVLDVGIGCGAFIEAHGNADGQDINPVAQEWLRERGLGGPIFTQVEAGCFWDSLEHLPNPSNWLSMFCPYVFVSLPIVKDPGRITAWKHFRPDEHRWYWTRDGFLAWMAEQSFECLEANSMEQTLGRQDIESFAFRRVR